MNSFTHSDFQISFQEFISFAPTVIGVVKRCGRYVRIISFGQRWLKISQPIIDAIAE